MMKEKDKLFFTKMEGAGNDYIYIDALGTPTSFNPLNYDLPDLSRKISDRHFGVGSDGLIAILPSSSADFRMRMFNADGSEAQMCGNGTRCVAKYVYDKGFTKKTVFTLETLAGIKTLHLQLSEEGDTENVTVDMGLARLHRKDIPASGKPEGKLIGELIEVFDEQFFITGVGMGNPHGVVFVDEITDRHIHTIGKVMETIDLWPERANIEFAKVIDRRHIRMRVWERGSGETLACGTGACATVVAAYLNDLTDPEADIELLGGTLHIRYDVASGHVFMTGPANFICEGVWLR